VNQRVIDYIPLTIEHELCQALANILQQRLFQAVFAEQNLSAERRRELVSEDPVVAARREQLEKKKKRLVEIKQTLDSPSTRAKARVPHAAKPAVVPLHSSAAREQDYGELSDSEVFIDRPCSPPRLSAPSFSGPQRVPRISLAPQAVSQVVLRESPALEEKVLMPIESAVPRIFRI
jgi:hypothetical protein